MSRANNGGWDFIKEGNIYQYKEDSLIAMVDILKDKSDDKYYRFKVRVVAANYDMVGKEFEVIHIKDLGGYYNGMSQFYEIAEYVPLPIGTPWPYAEKEFEFSGITGLV